jgi:hypothetical protein
MGEESVVKGSSSKGDEKKKMKVRRHGLLASITCGLGW